MGELPRLTGDTESSPGEGSKDSKEKGKDKAWVRPPLITGSSEKSPAEASPPPPPPSLFEQLVRQQEAPQEDDKAEKKDDDEDGEEDSDAAPVEAKQEKEEAPAAEAIAPDEQAGEGEFEAIMEQMGPEYAEATPGHELEEPEVLHIHHGPDGEESEPGYSEEAGSEEEATPDAASSASGGSTSPPPPPKPPVTPASPAPNQGPAFNRQPYVPSGNWNAAPATPNFSSNTVTSPYMTMEQHQAEINDAGYVAEKIGLRRGLVAGFITGYVLKAYLAGRKLKRYEKATEKQMDKQEERIDQLQREQRQLTEQMAAKAEEYRRRQAEMTRNQPNRFEKPAAGPLPETLPKLEPGSSEQIFDQEGNEIILQPGWHVERSAGGYSVVLDEHNRVVHDAIRYGEAFKRDQKREQLSEDLFASIGAGTAVGGPADQGLGRTPPEPVQPSGGQQVIRPEQPEQPADLKHRLPEPRNQVVATVTSPWLWTAIALLIIVYFIAALA